MESIWITDVSPRDGLQNQPKLLSTLDKLALIRLLVAAGLERVEVTSFVSPMAVPQMADAADLLSLVISQFPKLQSTVLVPNLKGLERAHLAGAGEVSVVLAATDTMNRKNIHQGLADATRNCQDTVRAARAMGMRTRAYLAVAFDCPFEGVTPLPTLLALAQQMQAAQVDEIVIADTIGSATHDTRGLAAANAWAALEAGIRRFDASAGGLGGCPFAPGAAGNLATEDLVLMAQGSGFQTNIDIGRLLDVIEFAQLKLDHPLGGRSYSWLALQKQKCDLGPRGLSEGQSDA
ncbi:MAG: hydroxymethylglutaryl-CoA lyase [Burkholderiales bacterium]|nr:hydroxymethylglutaryl-CoA lyase [Burkholderiales bacterium]